MVLMSTGTPVKQWNPRVKMVENERRTEQASYQRKRIDIREDKNHGIVVIDGREIHGWIDVTPCPRCGEARLYHDKHDAYFCAACNAWLESACSDPQCEYCKLRPERPLG